MVVRFGFPGGHYVLVRRLGLVAYIPVSIYMHALYVLTMYV